MSWRARVVEEAERWIGTPWHHRGRVLGAGVDCGQLLIAVYVAAGLIREFDPGAYPHDMMLHSDDELFTSWVERYMDAVEHPLPGDTVLWKFGRSFSHAGIITEWPCFIHAYRREGAVMRGDSRDADLMRRQVRFYTPRLT